MDKFSRLGKSRVIAAATSGLVLLGGGGMFIGPAGAEDLTFSAAVGSACTVSSDDDAGTMVINPTFTQMSSLLAGGDAATATVRATATRSTLTITVPDEFANHPGEYGGNETINVRAVEADGFQADDFTLEPAVGETEYAIHVRADDADGFSVGNYRVTVQVTCAPPGG